MRKRRMSVEGTEKTKRSSRWKTSCGFFFCVKVWSQVNKQTNKENNKQQKQDQR